MKIFKYCLLPISVCLVFVLSLQSCKEDSIINAGVVPLDDAISTDFTDTITILSKTFFDNDIVTSLSISGIPVNHALGNLTTDPYSGKTTAGFYFQIIPPTTSFTFAQNPTSAVLVLPYANFSWGDTMAPMDQMVAVYEIQDSLIRDSLYFSKSDVAVKPTILGTATIQYQTLKDSMMVNGENKAPHLRITLSQAFIDKIKAEATSGSGSFASNAAFLSFFRGLYVAPIGPTMGNVLHYFQLDGTSDYTRPTVLFYYTDTAMQVQSYPFFYISDFGVHFNKITRDYTGTLAHDLITSTALTDSAFLIQNEPGGVADLKIPFLKNLPKAPINKAQLIITQIPSADRLTYSPPERLFPVGVNADGTNYTILDRGNVQNSEPLIFIDGKRRDIFVNGAVYAQYVINIPREVQRTIVERKDTLHLRIGGASGFPGAYRLVAGGSTYSDPQFRIKLNIVYSKL